MIGIIAIAKTAMTIDMLHQMKNAVQAPQIEKAIEPLVSTAPAPRPAPLPTPYSSFRPRY